MCSTFQYEKTLLAAILGGEPFLNLLHTFSPLLAVVCILVRSCVAEYIMFSLSPSVVRSGSDDNGKWSLRHLSALLLYIKPGLRS